MTRIGAGLFLAVCACAPEPDGLLIITGDGVVDSSGPATLDVFVGVDRGIVAAPLTATRPFVLAALPDDLDRVWDDPSQPYSILLEPELAAGNELYVVLRGTQHGRPFGANLRKPVRYPGTGLYSAIADLYEPGDTGVCPHGTAEDAGYVVELVASVPVADMAIDCDQDGVRYPDDCTDYDAGIYPSPPYPPAGGIELPDERMCCNGPERAPATIDITRSGPGNCSLSIGCSPDEPFAGPFAVDWIVHPPFGKGESYCDCVEGGQYGPLDCLAGSNVLSPTDPGTPVQQPYCDVAVDDDGSVCPGQTSTVRDRFVGLLPVNPTVCPVHIVWQTGAVQVTLRSQGSTVQTFESEDCDADVVFDAVGPPPGFTTVNSAVGWAIIEVRGTLIPMHTHALPAPSGCARPIECNFE